MYKAVKACGTIAEFARQDEKTLMRWAAGLLGKAGKKITQRDMELLLTKTGTDMGNLRMELEKLISYTEGRDIVTAEDIEEICTTQTTNRIFDMVRAVTEKNQKRALDLYYDLLTLKEPPMRILFLLAKPVPSVTSGKTVCGSRTCPDRNCLKAWGTQLCCAKYLNMRQSVYHIRTGAGGRGFRGC